MSLKPLNLSALQAETIALQNTNSEIKLTELLYDKNAAYLNEYALFILKYNTIPNYMTEYSIDCVKANRWLIETYKDSIVDVHFRKTYSTIGNKTEFDEIHYCLYDDLIVSLNRLRTVVRFLFRNTPISKVEEIIIGIKKFEEKKDRTPKMSILVRASEGLEIRTLNLKTNRINIKSTYNDDFLSVHRVITTRILKQNDKGIILLHGKPGTGKTTYIRYLASIIKKKIIFLPPDIAGVITDPNFISILIQNPNSILVIEDAEKIIVDREKNGNSPVSALLNLSDGLLADCLNVQIICSFNTDLSKVDNALMRKGRLIAKYEFKELETSKAQELSDKLKFNTKILKPMTLNEIYNQNDISFQQTQQRNTIGFFANDN